MRLGCGDVGFARANDAAVAVRLEWKARGILGVHGRDDTAVHLEHVAIEADAVAGEGYDRLQETRARGQIPASVDEVADARRNGKEDRGSFLDGCIEIEPVEPSRQAWREVEGEAVRNGSRGDDWHQRSQDDEEREPPAIRCGPGWAARAKARTDRLDREDLPDDLDDDLIGRSSLGTSRARLTIGRFLHGIVFSRRAERRCLRFGKSEYVGKLPNGS